MWKALAIKELRDVGLIAAGSVFVAAIWTAGIVGVHVPWLGHRTQVLIPFLSSETLFPLIVISCATAIGLGLRQSTCVLNEASSQFLLHRPVDRYRLIGFKILFGLAIVVAVSSAVIFAMTVWAMVPGANPAPFEFWMTIPAWIAIFCVAIVYLAAFLSGLRPSSWYGTRLLPVIGSLPIALGVGAVCIWSLVAGVAIGMLILWLLWITIRDYANTRDYA